MPPVACPRGRVQQWRMDLEAFELVLLRRPESAPDYPDEELDRIQAEHLAYHTALREAQATSPPTARSPTSPTSRCAG